MYLAKETTKEKASLKTKNRFFSKLKDQKHLLFLLPTFLVFAVFMFWPLVYTVYLSFFDWNMIRPTKNFVGLANYAAIFSTPQALRVLGNSFLYILILLALNFVLPYILAFVLEVMITRFKNFFKPVLFIPSILSMVVGSMIYAWILNPVTGPVAHVLDSFGMTMPT